jgi:hypothetical protein
MSVGPFVAMAFTQIATPEAVTQAIESMPIVFTTISCSAAIAPAR